MNSALGKVLVLGGVRSGKSRFAQELAGRSGRSVTLIATAEARDEEMTARIEAHRRHRDARWRVIEEPVRLAAAVRDAASTGSIILVDCLTVWLSNLLCGEDGDAIRRETEALFAALDSLTGDCIVISNEVGYGIIPANPLARRFGDEAGVLHQRVAATCDRVVLMVAGLPLRVKGLPISRE